MTEALLQILYALVGSAGFALIFGQKLFSRVLPAALGGALSWAVYLLFEQWGGGAFFSSLAAGAFCCLWGEIMARIVKAPATVFLAVAIIPLVPGSTLYYTMSAVLRQDWGESGYYGVRTLLFALGIAAGIALVSALVYMLMKIPHGKRK